MFSIPQSETCILGAILMNPECLQQIKFELSHDDFMDQKNKVIYQTMLSLDKKGIPIIPSSIIDHLPKGKVKVVGEDIGEILAEVITSAGFAYHVKQVRSNRVKNELLAMSVSIADNAHKQEAISLLNETKDTISKIQPPAEHQKVITLAEALPGVFAGLEKQDANSITTGLADLDEVITGWQPGDLIIIAGRPGMGKSILAKDFAEAAGVPVLYFSLEMPVDQLIKRQLSAHSGVNYTSIRKAQCNTEDMDRIKKASELLFRMPISYSDKANMSSSELVATCNAYRKKNPLGLVVIDYLQLILADGRLEHREREVSQISARLKTLARELRVPVICLAQLNRACETRGGDKKPMLSDLRESGSIEQDADTVIFIWREIMYVKRTHDDGTMNTNDALLIVAKGRNTGVGTVKVFFDGAHQRFRGLSNNRRGK